MLIPIPLVAPPDAIELAIPAGATAGPHGDPRGSALAERAERACLAIGVDDPAVRAAVRVAVLRMAYRHGALGDDPHAYHNEAHALGLIERTLPALLATAPLPTHEREALALFCACHDLRQRESAATAGPIGANEAASIAETERLLAASGLDARPLRLALRFAIAGSTFATGSDDDASKGAFAHRLGGWLDGGHPGWRLDDDAVAAERLARIAADLDTGAIGGDYADFAAQAAALAAELQHRGGHALDTAAAGQACLRFLTDGQRRYVAHLHRFASAEGHAAFGARRDANVRRVAETADRLARRFAAGPAPDGHAVVAAFLALTAAAPAGSD